MNCLLILACLVSMTVSAQKTILKNNGVYISDSDFLHRRLTLGFNKGEGCKFNLNKSGSLLVKQRDSTYSYGYHQVWGYRYAGIDWHISDGDAYEVKYVGNICIFSSAGASPFRTSGTMYFSKDLTSPLFELTRKNLLSVYRSDTFFVQKIRSLPITTSIEKWDKQKQRYQFIDWLR